MSDYSQQRQDIIDAADTALEELNDSKNAEIEELESVISGLNDEIVALNKEIGELEAKVV